MKEGKLSKVAKFAKAGAFMKAPKKTYMTLHPVRGAKRAIFLRGLGTYVTPRNGLKLGAVIAVPVALMALRNARS